MTVDEDFNKLEDDIRRLKIEYEVYFNGASPRPPHDTLYRVEIMIKRYSSDQSLLNFSQRFRFMNLAQKYAVNSNLWRRKLQEKEEGRSLTGAQKRPIELPVDEGTVGVVSSDPDRETEKVDRLQEKEEGRSLTGSQKRPIETPAADGTVRVVCSDPDVETEKVSQLLQAVNEARRQAGQSILNLAAFHKVIKDKTEQFKKMHGCDKVQFTISTEDGKVKFKVTKAE